jgi:hypothetical protein
LRLWGEKAKRRKGEKDSGSFLKGGPGLPHLSGLFIGKFLVAQAPRRCLRVEKVENSEVIAAGTTWFMVRRGPGSVNLFLLQAVNCCYEKFKAQIAKLRHLRKPHHLSF